MSPETTSLFELCHEAWQLIGSLNVNKEAEWLTVSHVVSHLFGLVGENTSALPISMWKKNTQL